MFIPDVIHHKNNKMYKSNIEKLYSIIDSKKESYTKLITKQKELLIFFELQLHFEVGIHDK